MALTVDLATQRAKTNFKTKRIVLSRDEYYEEISKHLYGTKKYATEVKVKTLLELPPQNIPFFQLYSATCNALQINGENPTIFTNKDGNELIQVEIKESKRTFFRRLLNFFI